MLLLHMQEIVFVDYQEGLLSSRGGEGGGADILAPGLHCASVHEQKLHHNADCWQNGSESWRGRNMTVRSKSVSWVYHT